MLTRNNFVRDSQAALLERFPAVWWMLYSCSGALNFSTRARPVCSSDLQLNPGRQMKFECKNWRCVAVFWILVTQFTPKSPTEVGQNEPPCLTITGHFSIVGLVVVKHVKRQELLSLLFTLTKVTFSERGWPPVLSMKFRKGRHLQRWASNQFGAIQRWCKQVLRIWQNRWTKARSESTSFPNVQHSWLAKGHCGLLGKFHETRLYLAWHCHTMWSRLASLRPQSGHLGWAFSQTICCWREVELVTPRLRHWTKKSKGEIGK